MQDVVCNFYVEHISLVFFDVVPVCLEVVTYDHVVLDDVRGQYRTLALAEVILSASRFTRSSGWLII